MGRLDGQRALVTGASSGIGAAIAHRATARKLRHGRSRRRPRAVEATYRALASGA